jgi:hypothetical protein
MKDKFGYTQGPTMEELEEQVKKHEFAILWLLIFTVFMFGILLGVLCTIGFLG